MKVVVNSLKETEQVAFDFAKKLKGCEVIAFTGSMGAGKTAFTRALVEALGGGNIVSSPTFALVNEYNAKFAVKHFDMYRITDFESLYSTGFFDYLEQENTIMLIEWSENILEYLPENILKISIEHTDDENKRIITIERQGENIDNTCN